MFDRKLNVWFDPAIADSLRYGLDSAAKGQARAELVDLVDASREKTQCSNLKNGHHQASHHKDGSHFTRTVVELCLRIERDAIARYGLTVQDVEDVIETAIGGKNISSTVEGRERFPINVRYLQDYRTDPEALNRVLVAAPGGTQVPITQLAKLSFTMWPPVIKSQEAQFVGYVYVDVAGVDIGPM